MTYDFMIWGVVQTGKWGLLNHRAHAPLSNRSDLWLQGGGVFQPWSFGYVGRAANGAKSLANLYDFNIDYRLRPDVTLTG